MPPSSHSDGFKLSGVNKNKSVHEKWPQCQLYTKAIVKTNSSQTAKLNQVWLPYNNSDLLFLLFSNFLTNTSQVILFSTHLLVAKLNPPFQNSLDKVKGNTFMSQKTWPIRSLIELKNVFAAAGGRVVALTGGAGQVVEANHLACHQLDTPVKSN